MATVYSAQNGNWSDPTTWSTGTVPATGDYVYIRHTVTVDGDFSGTQLARIQFDSSYAGKLVFATDRDTAIKSDYFYWYFTNNNQQIQCGTPQAPLPAQYTCKIIQSAASTNYFYLRGRLNCSLQLCGDPAYYGNTRLARVNADWTAGQSFTVDGDLASRWRAGQKLGIASVNPAQGPASLTDIRNTSCYATIASLAYDAQADTTTITIQEANPGFTVYAGSPVVMLDRNIQIIHEQGSYDAAAIPPSTPNIDLADWDNGNTYQLSNVWFHGFGRAYIYDDFPNDDPSYVLEDLSFSCCYYTFSTQSTTVVLPPTNYARNISIARPTFFHCQYPLYGRGGNSFDGTYTDEAIAIACYSLRMHTTGGVDRNPIILANYAAYSYTLNQISRGATIGAVTRRLVSAAHAYCVSMRWDQTPWGDPAPPYEAYVSACNSRIEGLPDATTNTGSNNAFPDYMGSPGNFLTHQYGLAVSKSTTVTKDSDWSAMVVTASTMTTHPYIYPRPITHPHGDWGFEAEAGTTITIVAYVQATGVVGAFPTADQLYLEVEYLSDANAATRSVKRSTQTITANDTWTALTVQITPAQTGWVKCTLYLHNYHDDYWTLYVEPSIQLG